MTKKPIYPENALCILNKESFAYGFDNTFKKNVTYRVSFDEDQKGCLVYGEWMDIKTFESNFILYIPLLQERLRRLNLVVNGKPIPFKEFKELGYIVGRGYINLYIYSHPKENLFAFYPRNTHTKSQGLKECYKMFVDLVNGEIDGVDRGSIKWGNCGLPLGGGSPRREELQYIKEFEINLDLIN